MKRLFFVISLLWMSVAGFTLSAQEQETHDEKVMTIFDSLAEPGAGKGEVVIRQSEAVRNLVGARKHGANVERSQGNSYLKVEGFRAQVFSGNNQRLSKSEAYDKEKEVNEAFPDVPTYVTYVAPFWKLRVGDFRTHDEAYHMLRQLKEAFPTYGKEMYIVPETIQIPLN